MIQLFNVSDSNSWVALILVYQLYSPPLFFQQEPVLQFASGVDRVSTHQYGMNLGVKKSNYLDVSLH